MKTVAVSGGFDPLHVGHLSFFNAARRLGDWLVAVVESDEWVARKHSVLRPQQERARIVLAIKGVDDVYLNDRADGDCSAALLRMKVSVYAVGPDHADLSAVPEYGACTAAGIEVVCVQHPVRRSSSEILAGFSGKWANPPVTASALIVRAGKVLITRRAHAGGRELLEIPGGFVEVGESLEEAVAREVKEEVGVRVRNPVYFNSEVTTYCDGRKVLAVTFVCEADGEPSVTGESLGHFWVTSLPPNPFYATCDRNAVAAYFGGGR